MSAYSFIVLFCFVSLRKFVKIDFLVLIIYRL